MTAFHNALRASTRSVHEQLEQDSIFKEYFNEALNLDKYLAILNQMFTAYSHWQEELDLFFMNSRLSASFKINLYTDKQQKELAYSQGLKEISEKPGTLSIQNQENYLGCAYVFEGSKLGAKVIQRTLKSNQHLRPHKFHYFDACVVQDVSWTDWLGYLEEYVHAMQLDENKVIRGATNCFSALHQWFYFMK